MKRKTHQEQWREAKERSPGCIVLFRVGDFYEAYGEDAHILADVCGISLMELHRFPPLNDSRKMGGFPHHILENVLRKLLKTERKVAIAEYES